MPFLPRRKPKGRPPGKRGLAFVVERGHLDIMVGHAKREYPNEACGIVAGASGRIVRLYPTRNVERSPVRYVVDAREQLDVMREMEERGWDLLGIFHSHTNSPAYPSQTDIKLAYYPDALYFIVSLMDGISVVRAFYIREGQIEEAELVVE